MTKPQVAPYGSWKSPITSDMIASGTIRLEQVVLDRNDIYWIEMRPSEGGRCVIMRRSTLKGRSAKSPHLHSMPEPECTSTAAELSLSMQGGFFSPISQISVFIVKIMEDCCDQSHLPEIYDMQI